MISGLMRDWRRWSVGERIAALAILTASVVSLPAYVAMTLP